MKTVKIAAVAFIAFAMLAMGFASAAPGAYSSAATFVPYATAATGQNLTIYSNGTVSNSSLVTVNGNVYTLTQSLSGNLTVNASGITVAGNGYSVDGASGIMVNNATSLTLTGFGPIAGAGTSYLTALRSGNITLENSSVSSSLGNTVFIAIDAVTAVSLTGNIIKETSMSIAQAGSVSISNNNIVSGVLEVSSSGDVSITSNTYYLDVMSASLYYVGNVVYSGNHAVRQASLGPSSSYGMLSVEYAKNITVRNDNIALLQRSSNPGLDIYQASSVVVANSTFDGLSYNLIEWIGAVSISNTRMLNMSQYDGLSVWYGTSLTVNNVEAAQATSTGSYDSGMYVWQMKTVSVTNSTFFGSDALDLEDALLLTVTNNTVIQAPVSYDYGIYTYEIGNGTIAYNNIYSETTHYEYAVYIDEFTNVVFTHNNVYSEVASGGNLSYGIYLDYLSSSTVTDNFVGSYNGTSNFTYGIYLYYTGGVTVSGNTGSASDTAIYDEYGFGNTITGNTLSKAQYAIYVYYSANDYIAGNTATLPYDSYGLSIYDSTGGTYWNNTFSNAGTGLYLYYSVNNTFIANSFMGSGTSYYGIYSEVGTSSSYVGNTFLNFQTGAYLLDSSNATVMNNNFQTGQIGLYMDGTSGLAASGNTFAYYSYDINITAWIANSVFYHNNFINYTSVIQQVLNTTIVGSGVSFDMGSTVGGNYYTNYTGPFSNGLGTVAYNLGYGLSDSNPLQYQWQDPVITFVSTGLSAGTQWSVTVNGNTYSTTKASISVPINLGAYGPIYYTVGSVAGYSHKASAGTVYYQGSSVTAFVNYAQVKYGITFRGTGLPSGDAFTVSIGGTSHAINGTGVVDLANGTYNYTVTPPNDFRTPDMAGTLTVSGSNVTVSIPFLTTGYTVTFEETGLSNNVTWTVDLNGQAYNGTGSEISFTAVQPGTYTYTVTGPSGYTYTASGNVSVHGNITVAVGFTHPGVGAGVLAGSIIGGIVAGFVAMLLVALFAPQFVDNLRKRVSGLGNRQGSKAGSGQQEQQNAESGSEANTEEKKD